MADVPAVSEDDLWLAELDLVDGTDHAPRRIQFAIRTATRAQALARRAGSDPIDELLDARARVKSAAARSVFERAIDYLYTDRLFNADRDLRRAGGIVFAVGTPL
ncbi:MAG TPA: hypothetical protein VLJ88_13340 [Propionibacteriaceae bacterium]|nr:hypothetical protein [Propionibacteriaceae bacterium]